MKRFRLFLCSLIFLSGTLSVQAASFQPFIPTETLKIAHEAEVRASQLKPASEVVRVGIGTSGFASYDYKEISIFGTDGIQVYNNGMSIFFRTILKKY